MTTREKMRERVERVERAERAVTAPTSIAVPAPTSIAVTYAPISSAQRVWTLPAGYVPPAPGELKLLTRGEVLERVAMSYPTVWSKMRAGMFPRSRVVGARVCWYAHEIDAWIATLPMAKLKGDVATEETETAAE